MLRLSKKMFYAVEAVLYIAYNSQSDPISSKVIAERQKLQPRYLEQIMQHLVRSGILRGVRGPKGGYVLAKEKRRIHVAEICQVINGMDDFEEDQFQQTSLSELIVYPLCKDVEENVYGTLNDVTLADLCDKANALSVSREAENSTDFMI